MPVRTHTADPGEHTSTPTSVNIPSSVLLPAPRTALSHTIRTTLASSAAPLRAGHACGVAVPSPARLDPHPIGAMHQQPVTLTQMRGPESAAARRSA